MTIGGDKRVVLFRHLSARYLFGQSSLFRNVTSRIELKPKVLFSLSVYKMGLEKWIKRRSDALNVLIESNIGFFNLTDI